MKLSAKNWNQGNLDQNPFPMDRERASHRVHVDAPVARVFELACLAGQPGWLPAGSTRLCYSDSGGDEVDAVWSDSMTGPALLGQPGAVSFWTTTEITPEAHRYQAVLANPDLAIGTLDIEMTPDGEGTAVRFGLSCTALGKAGSSLFGADIRTRIEELLVRFGRTLTNVVAAGRALRLVAEPQQAQRKTVEQVADIKGDIDECFALACPVAELRWIDNWQFDLIYSESGRNETGCVFLEPFTGLAILSRPGVNNYWYATRFDREAHSFEAVWLTQDLTIARWRLTMTDIGGGQVRVHWWLSYTSLGPEGSRIIADSDLQKRMRQALLFLSVSLKTYVETGTCFRIPTTRKLQLAAALIGAAMGRHWRRVHGGCQSTAASAS